MEVTIHDSEVVKLIINYLHSRGLFWAASSLQLESNVVNEFIPEPFSTVKECCLGGRWQDVRKLLQPFVEIYHDQLNWKSIVCLLYRQRFCELCFEGQLEDAPTALKDIIEEVTSCHDNDEYDKIVQDVCNYYNKIVSKYTHSYAMKQVTRAETFRQLFAFIYPILKSNGVNMTTTKSSLVNLLAKGLLFDKCDQYCYERATGQLQQNENQTILDGSLRSYSTKQVSASLFNWIQSFKENDMFQRKFHDREVKIIQKTFSEQDETTLNTLAEQNQRERLDSTFVKTPTAVHSKSDGNETYTTMTKSSALLDQRTTAVQTNAVISTAPENPETLNGSVRSAWGDAFLPNSSVMKECSLDSSYDTASVESPAVATKKSKNVSVPTKVGVSKSTQIENHPDFPQEIANKPSSPPHHLSANPASWDHPRSNTATNLNSSIRDSYADFINEQSIARRDYNQLMEQLQAKQHEAQALRNFLQGGNSVVHGTSTSTERPLQGVSAQQGNTAFMNKSVDQSAYSQQASQQVPEKLPHTDRRPSGAPSPPSFRKQLQPGERTNTNSDELAKMKNQAAHVKKQTNRSGNLESGISQLNGNPQGPASQSSAYQPYQQNNHQTKPDSLKLSTTQHLSYIPLARTDDPAVIRSVAFHPRGHVMAIGSNSRVLKLCQIPKEALDPSSIRNVNCCFDLRKLMVNKIAFRCNPRADTEDPERLHVIVKKSQVHRGSIYALAWNDSGTILSTCSNDKLIKIFTFNEDSQSLLGPQYELTHHDGMVRDITFLSGYGSGSVLASGGSSDCVVYTYACEVDTVVHQLTGHSDQILSLYSWNGGMLVSASQDRSVRIWDLRSSRCVSVLGFGKSADDHSVPLSVCVNEQGHWMGVGRDDSLVSLYDLRAARAIGDYTCHSGEVRSVRFNPADNQTLMSSSYDGTAVIADINSVFSGAHRETASCTRRCTFHNDKVIQSRWHCEGMCFATTSADQSCVLWRAANA